ncbi:YqgE/AlgH family protein [Desulfoluna spongiiphila]|uniref:UPF0301 protein SAMN05216233_116105 n=1 Tax=Desulfoluna spongiiphila TaxID=419481 RepID=A0A1G5HYX3_9BACT|nr:YqgE/AlgH family protein [Desulfoluna spongiiphila]SCY69003.1 putative transcriptional regulator [Desulfoluna spongiiphila]VVS94938.1 protein of unknown function upf0301 [Desulfoluna spongiiphila]
MSGDAFQSFKGHFLLAMPSMKDPNFSRTVVYLCEHTVDGAMGFIVNRPSHLMAALDVYKEFKLEHVDTAAGVPVYTGGPVQLDEIFLLHGPPFDTEGTFPMGGEVALSNSMATLSAVAKGEGPEKVAIFLGSSGWAAGQLEGELVGNVWLTVESGSDLIFDVPAEMRWENALDRLGIDPVLLSGDFGRA